MPTIQISKKDLCNLIGKKLTDRELEEDLLLVKGEIEDIEGDLVKVEIADTNRPELWSTEGIAREIRTKYEKDSINLSKIPSSKLKVIIDKNLKNIRPKTVCAVVRGLKLTDEILNQIIQLQEKICDGFGNRRKEAAIGIYDLHKITGPIIYKGFKPKDLKFKPLDFPKEVFLNQILSQHPKGKEYGFLLENCDLYPVFIDSKNEVLSMPPIINSDHTGKVGLDTKDVFIECSGFAEKFIEPALNAMVLALVERGGSLETVEVEYHNEKIITPNLKPKTIEIDSEYINKRAGIEFKNLKELLEQAHYNILSNKNGRLKLEYPAYRQDIMHPADVAEDVMIRYGFNNFIPTLPELNTTKSMIDINQFVPKIANILVGLGAQEVMSYTLTNKENHISKMNLKDLKVIEVDNPVSKNWSVFRSWVTPCLIEILGKNTNVEYPQQIFEIGQVVKYDSKQDVKTSNPTRLAWAKADKTADFTIAKQALDFLFRTIDLDYEIEETTHDSFIKGRVGRVYINKKAVAYIGEIHPKVLSEFGIAMPVCAFELNLTEVLQCIKRK